MKVSARSIVNVLFGIALGALGSLLLLEVSSRIFVFGMAGLDSARVASVHTIWETGYLRASRDPMLRYELRPDVDGYFKLARFRTNSRGLADREYSVVKPPDTFRAAVIGASFTLPSGVEIEDAFHTILEERLTDESPSLAYEFINFAVGGYGPRSQLAMLRLRALEYDPDLVIFAATDLSTPHLRTAWNAPYPWPRSLEPRYTFFKSFFVELLRVRLGLKRVVPEPPSAYRSEEGVPTILEKLAEISRETGVPVVVVRLEIDPRAPTRTDEAAARAARAEGLHFVDTRSAFEGMDPRDFWIYALDRHPNAEAHAIFADVLGEFLRSSDLIDERT